MYLHLGNETVIKTEQIIGIFDLDTATVSKRTRDYLAKAEKKGDVITITAELPKSYIVCRAPDRPSGRIIYLSQISSTTLLHRAVSFE